MFIKHFGNRGIVFLCWLIISFFTGCKFHHEIINETWANYLGDKSVSHYSSLRQIDTANVHELKVAWKYHTGDADSLTHSQIQCNPIIIGDVLFGTSPRLKLFALEAATGSEKWVFDPFSDTSKTKVEINANRGVTYW